MLICGKPKQKTWTYVSVVAAGPLYEMSFWGLFCFLGQDVCYRTHEAELQGKVPDRGHNGIPISNPMSILNMVLLRIKLT